ncbi:MAG: hypothetical protein H6P95_2657, partial [Candidatus Aminicenantes bacterium]|nr:hypothetical protein [Candidatus Aminicenantes bacterium]
MTTARGLGTTLGILAFLSALGAAACGGGPTEVKIV